MQNLDYFLKETGLKCIGSSTVWDFHNCNNLDNIALKKGTNINNELLKLKAIGVTGQITLYAHSIGRSAHSATQVAILQGFTDLDHCGNYYSARIGEVLMSSVGE